MLNYKRLSDEIVILIVLYKTQLNDSKSYQCIKKSQARLSSPIDLIIYDNSPERMAFEDDLKSNNFEYIHNPNNSGLSATYNHVVRLSAPKNKKWLLILDQDTELPAKILETYLAAINDNPDLSIFVPILVNTLNTIISPSIFKFRRGRSPKSINYGLNKLREFSPVNSGIMVKISLYNKVGGYNERIPLDYSDYDFIERLGDINFFVIAARCVQSLSANEYPPYQSALIRFRYLCIGLKNSSKNVKDSMLSIVVLLRRGLKLSAKYRSLAFFKVIIDEYK